MDVAAFRGALIARLGRAGLGLDVGVYRSRPPTGSGKFVIVAGGSYTSDRTSFGTSGRSYRQVLRQEVVVGSPQGYATPETSETEVYQLAGRVAVAAQGMDGTDVEGLTSVVPTSLEEESGWWNGEEQVRLRLVLECVSYGPDLYGVTT